MERGATIHHPALFSSLLMRIMVVVEGGGMPPPLLHQAPPSAPYPVGLVVAVGGAAVKPFGVDPNALPVIPAPDRYLFEFQPLPIFGDVADVLDALEAVVLRPAD